MFFPLFTLRPSKSLSFSCQEQWQKGNKKKSKLSGGHRTISRVQSHLGFESLHTPSVLQENPGIFLSLFCSLRALSVLFWLLLLCFTLHLTITVPGLFCMSLIHLPSINTAFRFLHPTHHYFKREYHYWNTLLPFMIAGSMWSKSFSFPLFITPH